MTKLFAVLLLSACSASLPSPARIRGYDFALEKEAPYEAPYVARFQKNGKTLAFVAAAHFSKATLHAVEETFHRLAPQAVVVEGIRSQSLLSKPGVQNHLNECRLSHFGDNCGESWFAVAEALSSGARYVAGEPDDEKILGDIRGQGFSDEDLLTLFVAREIPQHHFSKGEFEPWVKKRLAELHRALPDAAPFTLDDFLQRQRTTALQTNDVAPVDSPAATPLQKISHAVTIARDRHVVKVVAELLTRFDRVLVVYGASHLLTQLPAYEEAMGHGEFEKLN